MKINSLFALSIFFCSVSIFNFNNVYREILPVSKSKYGLFSLHLFVPLLPSSSIEQQQLVWNCWWYYYHVQIGECNVLTDAKVSNDKFSLSLFSFVSSVFKQAHRMLHFFCCLLCMQTVNRETNFVLHIFVLRQSFTLWLLSLKIKKKHHHIVRKKNDRYTYGYVCWIVKHYSPRGHYRNNVTVNPEGVYTESSKCVCVFIRVNMSHNNITDNE